MSDTTSLKYNYDTNLSDLSAEKTYKWMLKTIEWLPKCRARISTNRTRWNLTDTQVETIQADLETLHARSETIKRALPPNFVARWMTSSTEEASCKKQIADFQKALLEALRPILEYGRPKGNELTRVNTESRMSEAGLSVGLESYPLSLVSSCTTSNTRTGPPSPESTRNPSSRGSPVLSRDMEFRPPRLPLSAQFNQGGPYVMAVTTSGNDRVELPGPNQQFWAGENGAEYPDLPEEENFI